MFINLKVNNINLGRVERLKITSSITTHLQLAETVITPEKSLDITPIVLGSDVVIDYGNDQKSKKFVGTIVSVIFDVDNKIHITSADSGLKLNRTFITESYNDETSLTVIKRLVALAGFSNYEISIPDILIPHMIFNSISIKQALDRIIDSIKKQRDDKQLIRYWLDDNKFFMCNVFSDSAKTHIFNTGENIIKHSIRSNGLSSIITALNLDIKHSDILKIDDVKKNFKSNVHILDLENSIDQGVGRTKLWY